MDELKDINIPIGWTAFVKDKTVFGITEFKKLGLAHTSLTVISKDTKQELLDEILNQGLTYIEPATPSS